MSNKRANKSSILKGKLSLLMQRKTRINDKLDEISRLSEVCNLDYLFNQIQQQNSAMNLFKYLLLLHRILIRGVKSEEIMDFLMEFKPTFAQKSPTEGLLMSRLLIPYQRFLQKRSFYLAEIIPREHQIYQLFNLIKAAAEFMDVLYILGRYFYRQNNWVLDFNVLLAQDLKELYVILKSKITVNFARDNINELERLHEGLFNIFYNCYFNKYVSKYAPIWISTEGLQDESLQAAYKKRKQLALNTTHEKTIIQTQQSSELGEEDDSQIDLQRRDFISTAAEIISFCEDKENQLFTLEQFD